MIIMNKLVEQKRFIDSVTAESAMLKDIFLIKGYMAFCVSLVQGETVDCYAKEYLETSHMYLRLDGRNRLK